MPGKLPDKIDPKRLAHQGAVLEGDIPVAALSRLGAAFEVREPAHAHLTFAWSSRHRPAVTGEVSVRIASTCQRCLQAFETVVTATVDIEIGEAPRDTEQDFELLLQPDEPLQIATLVEDELLLEAPMIPVHAPSECAAPAVTPDDPAEVAAGEDDETRRPFADLQALLTRPKQ